MAQVQTPSHLDVSTAQAHSSALGVQSTVLTMMNLPLQTSNVCLPVFFRVCGSCTYIAKGAVRPRPCLPPVRPELPLIHARICRGRRSTGYVVMILSRSSFESFSKAPPLWYRLDTTFQAPASICVDVCFVKEAMAIMRVSRHLQSSVRF